MNKGEKKTNQGGDRQKKMESRGEGKEKGEIERGVEGKGEGGHRANNEENKGEGKEKGEI